MDIEKAKAIEKLKKWSEWIISKYPTNTIRDDDDWFGVENGIDTLDLALTIKAALLDEPVCKTCGGTGEIENPVNAGEGNKWDCPACQQLPAGDEFTKELRKICEEEKKERPPFIEPQIVEEACDRLDLLESQLAKRGEAIRTLYIYKNQTKILKRILDKDFDKIIGENNENNSAHQKPSGVG